MTIDTQKLRAFRQSLKRCASNTGHGHVYMRPDGFLEKCGGPGICTECAKDLALLMAHDGYEPPTTDDLIDTIDAQAAQLEAYPADWRSDSSLETWFPLTAERLKAQRAEIARLRSRIAELRVAVQSLLDCPSGIYCDGYQDAEHKARTALQEKSNG